MKKETIIKQGYSGNILVKSRKWLSALLTVILVFAMIVPALNVSAREFEKEEYTQLYLNNSGVTTSTQTFTSDLMHRYFGFNSKGGYYRIAVTNQTAEDKQSIIVDDESSEKFYGKIDLEVFDGNDSSLAKTSVQCGYTDGVTLYLESGSCYIKVSSDKLLSYRVTIKPFTSIGGSMWQMATDGILPGRISSKLETSKSENWYTFETDNFDYFYNFKFNNVSGTQSMSLQLFEYDEAIQDPLPLKELFNTTISRFDIKDTSVKLKPNTKYYICVSTATGGSGDYQLDVNQSVDLPGETINTAYKIEPDTKYTTRIDANGDVDFFKFTTKDYNAYYYFNLQNLTIPAECYINLYDADGQELASGRSYDKADFSVNAKLNPNEVYYIKVRTDSNATGEYSIKINDVADSGGNSISNAVQVELRQEHTANISGYGDEDFFKITTDAIDAYYYFDISGLDISADHHFRLYDKSGNQISTAKSYGKKTSVNFRLDPNTIYYFSILAEGNGTGDYSFNITTKEDAQPNVQSKAVKIELDELLAAHITGDGDIDFFKFTTLDYAAYYHFNMINRGLNQSFYLRVYDAAGNEICNGIGSDNSSIFITCKLDANKVYYFATSAYENTKGDYELYITSKSDPEPNVQENALETSAVGEIKGAVSGEGDIDWFKFTTDMYGAYYFFDFKNLNINNDYFLYVYDAEGTELCGKRSYSNYGISVNTRLEPNTEYYIKVYAWNDGIGDYKITVSKVDDEAGDTKQQAAAIPFNTTQEFALESDNDIDWYKFVLNESCNMRLLVTNVGGDGAKLKKVELYSIIDKQLLSYSVGNKSNKTIYLDKGTYYLKVYNKAGKYTLAVSTCGDAHIEKYEIVKATTTTNGKKVTYCDSCGAEISKEIIYYVSKISLSSTSLIYNGKNQKPSVVVKDSMGNIISESNYTVTYPSNCKNVGTYTVKVNLEGDYSGSKELTYTIKAEYGANLKISFSSATYTYTGKVQSPKVVVERADGTILKSGTDYTVSYIGKRIACGRYNVNVSFKGNYTGNRLVGFTIVKGTMSQLTVSYSKSSAYNGKIKTPIVTIKNSAGVTLNKGIDYTVTYTGTRKTVGKYSFIVKLRGNYTGSKTYTFQIVPAATKISKIAPSKKSLKVTIAKKTAQVTGYEIQYSTNKKFSGYKTKTIKSYKTASSTLSGLKAKTTYYIRVRTYKTVGSTKYYSSWSAIKSAKTK